MVSNSSGHLCGVLCRLVVSSGHWLSVVVSGGQQWSLMVSCRTVVNGGGQWWSVVVINGQLCYVLCRMVVSTWWLLMSPMSMSCRCGTGRRLTVVKRSLKSGSVAVQ